MPARVDAFWDEPSQAALSKAMRGVLRLCRSPSAWEAEEAQGCKQAHKAQRNAGGSPTPPAGSGRHPPSGGFRGQRIQLCWEQPNALSDISYSLVLWLLGIGDPGSEVDATPSLGQLVSDQCATGAKMGVGMEEMGWATGV